MNKEYHNVLKLVILGKSCNRSTYLKISNIVIEKIQNTKGRKIENLANTVTHFIARYGMNIYSILKEQLRNS